MEQRCHPFEPRDPFPFDEGSRASQVLGVVLGMGWLAIPIINTATSSQTAWRVALCVVLFGAALLAYLDGIGGRRPPHADRRVHAALATITLAGIVLTLVVSPSWAILFTYGSVISGIHLEPRQGAPLLFAFVALATVLNLHEGVANAVSWGVTALGVGALMLALGRLIHANMQLQAAHERIEQLAVEAERERFARDLHDLLGHSLSVITLKAELSGRLLPDRPKEARRHVGELERVARDALGEVRETVSGYRRPTLAGELAGARVALDAAGIEMRVRERERDGELPAEVEALLAWTVREGTTNVIRHSGARRCEIAIVPDPAAGAASAEIHDDGRGSDGGAPSRGSAGNGLDGLRERASLLAGTVEAGAAPDGGFRLRVTVPLAAGAAA
ncbi:sensor histidine kinase [Conexibacter arvalis]|uniref:Two-component system sensor histidine kinase DesK n=1 Tax=Conexibacter arvalis TaxID=912552 RepID=A0A840IDC1_9ACTN|nr:sensor histidine kinase [Conexibacter arvalis]MBB4662064.1 two-component system sensor histidine kinase DesK [Conexibacter arvalis]